VIIELRDDDLEEMDQTVVKGAAAGSRKHGDPQRSPKPPATDSAGRSPDSSERSAASPKR
jgi:hypothetical protein